MFLLVILVCLMNFDIIWELINLCVWVGFEVGDGIVFDKFIGGFVVCV